MDEVFGQTLIAAADFVSPGWGLTDAKARKNVPAFFQQNLKNNLRMNWWQGITNVKL